MKPKRLRWRWTRASASSMRLEISTSCSTREQGHLAHLLEVHPHRVVEDIQPAVGLGLVVVGLLVLLVVLFALAVEFAVLFLFKVFVAVNVRGFDDVEFHRAQPRLDGLDQVGIVDAVRERLVEVVPRQVTLFLGELDEFADFLLRIVRLRRDLGRGRRDVMDDRLCSGRRPWRVSRPSAPRAWCLSPRVSRISASLWFQRQFPCEAWGRREQTGSLWP